MKMLDDTGIQMERSPRKSLHQLSVESGMWKSTAHRTPKLLELHPYKISHTTLCSAMGSRKPLLQVVLQNVSLCITWSGNSSFLWMRHSLPKNGNINNQNTDTDVPFTPMQ